MSDRYERCAHGEQPSKCTYCAREQIDALRAERDEATMGVLNANVTIAELRGERDEAVALLREAQPFIGREPLSVREQIDWLTPIGNRIDAFLAKLEAEP